MQTLQQRVWGHSKASQENSNLPECIWHGCLSWRKKVAETCKAKNANEKQLWTEERKGSFSQKVTLWKK